MRAAGGEELVIGMLHLDHRRAILGMRPVSKALLDVIGFDVLDARALVPGESQILALALEVVFDMTVGAYHRAHLLAREGAPVPALFPERFHKILNQPELVTIPGRSSTRDDNIGDKQVVAAPGFTPGLKHFDFKISIFKNRLEFGHSPLAAGITRQNLESPGARRRHLRAPKTDDRRQFAFTVSGPYRLKYGIKDGFLDPVNVVPHFKTRAVGGHTGPHAARQPGREFPA
ncbi:MAG: hypothetical protein BWY44_00967 [Candidatus Omnitrophica bacterium ADurb.Bin292]|nr:MAG: hypothetical protein BWY44_00967 [Candidatus Omnitrophica bacterium ADurb.Bin292]